MNDSAILVILQQIGLKEIPHSITQFQNEEDSGFYNVWKVETDSATLVLKQSKGFESEVYQTFFSHPQPFAPRLIGTMKAKDKHYLLMEYIPGKNLMYCTRELLTKALNSLIHMQTEYWGNTDSANRGQSYERSLIGRVNRREYLNDSQLESAYEEYLLEYSNLPRTLCHDDFLPFNVIINDDRAVFIDWEYGGILPYPTALVRLIAHGEEREDALFYMREADKAFSIQYYYEKLVQKCGIPYENYLRSIRLFLFYEYCEWIFVGNKYGETDNDRFRRYLQKANEMAQLLGY